MNFRPALSAIAAAILLPLAAPSWSAVSVSVNFGPPPLPVYEQPVIPGDGYIWTPGYWAWDDDYGDYYWVPGTWVMAPRPGYLWTPAYWAWEGVGFRFHEGYWGPHIGFYGGINYGFGYFGNGYEGGRWDRGHFYYNTAVNNVPRTVVHNTYIQNVTVNVNTPRPSFNGGNGGVNARPTPEQERFAQNTHEHLQPTSHQMEQEKVALRMPELRAGQNHGAPPIAATAKPAEFQSPQVVKAKNAPTVSGPPPRQGGAAGEGRNNNAGNANTPNNPRNNEAGRGAEPGNTGINGNNVPRPGNEPQRPQRDMNRGQPQGGQAQPQGEQPQTPQQQQQHQRPGRGQQAQPQGEAPPAAQPPQQHGRPDRHPPQGQPAPQAQPVPQPQERPQAPPQPERHPQAQPQPQAQPAPAPAPQPERRAPEEKKRPDERKNER